jgi:tetratricopeptide (TPR) repeat protein
MKRLGHWAGRVILVLACLAVLALVWVRWGGPVRSQIVEWTKSDSTRAAEAASAYEAGDWKRAADLTRPILKSQSDNTLALRVYARASTRLEHDSAAAAIYTGRLGLSRLETEDRFLLGLLHARAGQFQSAFDLWEEAAHQPDSSAELLDNLARLSIRLQRMDEAADAARRLSRWPSWEVRGSLLLGDILAFLDDPKGSVDAFRAALERDPTASGALLPISHYRKRLARGLLRLGFPGEARQVLDALRKSDGSGALDQEAQWLLSRAWLEEGKLQEAASALALAGRYRTDNPLDPEPSPYSGGASCASCHRELSRSHEQSRHARTFHHGKGLLDLPIPDRPLADPDDPKVTHGFTRENDKIKVETHSGDKIYRLVVDYAFGTSDHYVTMIGRDDDRTFRALRLSSFHAADGVSWGRTAGDVPDSNSGENIRGEPIKVRDGVVRCLYCHVTFYRDFRDPPPEAVSPAAADRAIGCERCHGPGGNHIKAIKGDFAENAIVNPGTGGAQAIGKLCADCHIVGSQADINKAPDDPRFVRSPGLTFTYSRCFTESDGAMSCMTCHDAHRDDQGTEAFYVAKCLSCHAASRPEKKKAKTAPAEGIRGEARKPTVCPVNATTKCLECHMPKVPMPTLHRELTDHYIRVHDGGTKK